ncbi:MAG: hypothetical protein ACFHVJ_00265 [Aestuariibacter sp.]
MDTLSRFYIDLATDANKMKAFNLASSEEREAMLQSAGVKNAAQYVDFNKDQLRKALAKSLIADTQSWYGLDSNTGNDDNRNNVGRLGLSKRH